MQSDLATSRGRGKHVGAWTVRTCHPNGDESSIGPSASRAALHLDFVVDDLDDVVRRACAAGATLDREVQERPYGRLANLADPFGHGLCILQMNERGYDALLEEGEQLEPA